MINTVTVPGKSELVCNGEFEVEPGTEVEPSTEVKLIVEGKLGNVGMPGNVGKPGTEVGTEVGVLATAGPTLMGTPMLLQ